MVISTRCLIIKIVDCEIIFAVCVRVVWGKNADGKSVFLLFYTD